MKLTPARALAPALVVLALAVGAGCSGSGSDADPGAGSNDSAPQSRSQGEAPEEASAELADGADVAAAEYGHADTLSLGEPEQQPLARALIRRGNVSLRADDVGKAQFEVQKVVDRYGGQVTEEKTTTDDDGHPAYTRMVLRIPAGDFSAAMEALKGVAELESASTSEDDVTTKVIDTQTRLKVQRRSISRITTLFGQAQSIRDIMAIEAQLSRRQADLDSLERQAAYLANQTSLSTIAVSVDEIPPTKVAVKDGDDAGFLSGLSAGWHSLTTFAVALATVAGALLPWLVVAVILGPPVLLLARAARRRRAVPADPNPAES
jgi:hypothetical protein